MSTVRCVSAPGGRSLTDHRSWCFFLLPPVQDSHRVCTGLSLVPVLGEALSREYEGSELRRLPRARIDPVPDPYPCPGQQSEVGLRSEAHRALERRDLGIRPLSEALEPGGWLVQRESPSA